MNEQNIIKNQNFQTGLNLIFDECSKIQLVMTRFSDFLDASKEQIRLDMTATLCDSDSSRREN